METIAIGLTIPLLGTMLGSAFVFFMKDEMPERVQKTLLGFASGVMVAASVWSLLIPAMEMEEAKGAWSMFPASIGFLLGIGFLLMIDELTPHLHIGNDKPEGPRSRLSRTAMLALAVTIHNLPEGMAVGIVFAGAQDSASGLSLASALAVSIGIAIQNIPEGAIISMPMRAEGNSRWRDWRFGSRVAGFADDSCPAVYALLRSRSHALCCRRRAYPRGIGWQTYQPQHHRLCCRLCADDGARCGLGVISSLTIDY